MGSIDGSRGIMTILHFNNGWKKETRGLENNAFLNYFFCKERNYDQYAYDAVRCEYKMPIHS